VINKKSKQSITNKLTTDVQNFLLKKRVLCWREDSGGVPVHKNGVVTGFKPPAKRGKPDVFGVFPALTNKNGRNMWGVLLALEIKTGKDRLSTVQEAFLKSVKQQGGITWVIHSMEELEFEWIRLFGRPEDQVKTEIEVDLPRAAVISNTFIY